MTSHEVSTDNLGVESPGFVFGLGPTPDLRGPRK